MSRVIVQGILPMSLFPLQGGKGTESLAFVNLEIGMMSNTRINHPVSIKDNDDKRETDNQNL